MKQDDYFELILTTFKSLNFRGSSYSSDNWLEPKIEPPSENLTCTNPWNTLYQMSRRFAFWFDIIQKICCSGLKRGREVTSPLPQDLDQPLKLEGVASSLVSHHFMKERTFWSNIFFFLNLIFVWGKTF